ncbi:MAG: hypothetical protein JWP08_3392, partial [Bryobacterales bacterium]|nr:hypothetical protein [Bryobacterales bacterium]
RPYRDLDDRGAGSRKQAVCLSAGVFSVFCSRAPLLLPDQYLPAPIRVAHAVEMGASGIAFGTPVRFMLLKPRETINAPG